MRWLQDELVSRFGPQCVSLHDTELRRHAADMSLTRPCPPDLIFYPEDSYQISWLLEHVAEGVCVVPFGKGTSTEGQTVPTGPASVSLDMHRMRRILEYNRVDRTVRVETGLDLAALNLVLEEDGLCFPIDPMMNATIGGMISSNASGLSVCRYGPLSNYIDSIKVVLADGRELCITHQAFLKGLFMGSEGKLGVVTEATLKLKPVARDLKTVWAGFSRLEDAAMAIPRVLEEQNGLVKCVLLSDCAIQAINRQHGMSLTDSPALLMEIQTDEKFVLEGCPAVVCIEKVDDGAIWSRLSAIWFHAEGQSIPTTVRLAPTRLPEVIREFHQDGHPDCCLLANCGASTVTIVKPAAESERFCEELFPLVRRLGGSLAGHGMAPEQKVWAQEELNSAQPLFAMIKKALDPREVLGHPPI